MGRLEKSSPLLARFFHTRHGRIEWMRVMSACDMDTRTSDWTRTAGAFLSSVRDLCTLSFVRHRSRTEARNAEMVSRCKQRVQVAHPSSYS